MYSKYANLIKNLQKALSDSLSVIIEDCIFHIVHLVHFILPNKYEFGVFLQKSNLRPAVYNPKSEKAEVEIEIDNNDL